MIKYKGHLFDNLPIIHNPIVADRYCYVQANGEKVIPANPEAMIIPAHCRLLFNDGEVFSHQPSRRIRGHGKTIAEAILRYLNRCTDDRSIIFMTNSRHFLKSIENPCYKDRLIRKVGDLLAECRSQFAVCFIPKRFLDFGIKFCQDSQSQEPGRQ